jgi:rare lipoprotein A
LQRSIPDDLDKGPCRMTFWRRTTLTFALTAVLCGCAAPRQAPPPPAPPAPAPVVSAPAPDAPTFTQQGRASWYGQFHQGQKTASGEPYDMNAMTAAHRSLPFGSVVRVTEIKSGKSVKVRINDRGPRIKNRVIDLSAGAARQLGISDHGVAQVRIEQFAGDQLAAGN